MSLSIAAKREYQEYLDLCRQIREATGELVPNETAREKEVRKKTLLDSFVNFAKYYFPHYLDSEFAWFHRKAAKAIQRDPNIFLILEWPREHAKSVFADIMVPLWMYARGEISGMIIASANEDKATNLLSDLQSNFEANIRWINDYGELAAAGDWRNGYFATTDGVGFWSFGRGQSPRGVRKAAKRPNYAVVDDIDDKVIVRNEKRVRDAVDWVLEDLYGALSLQGSRMVIVGNRIHSKGILAHLVGDTEPDSPKREGITHIKVYAFEDANHNKDDKGQPAWRERYTREMLLDRMSKVGYRAARREYFHEHIEDGVVFLNEWIKWEKPPAPAQMDELITYGDPSFKNTKSSDYKAVVTVGRKGRNLYVLYAWVAQASINTMVNVFYDVYEKFGTYSRYYIEANMLQDLLFDDEFVAVGDQRGHQLPIRQDKRKKPDKYTRVENMSPLFERELISFHKNRRKSAGMKTLIQQLLAFPTGHDDGPDALEGAISLLNAGSKSSKFEPRTGKFNRQSNRI